MRADNLIHGATGVVVRNSSGQIYVHRRTDTKDVYPGRYDFAAGGVLAVGEDPDEAALRELHEELGVRGVELTSLGRGFFADQHTRYWGFLYVCEWDGQITWQPEEVAWGGWWSREQLIEALDDPSRSFMPDTVALLGDWLRSS